jgi:hypothetical protein
MVRWYSARRSDSAREARRRSRDRHGGCPGRAPAVLEPAVLEPAVLEPAVLEPAVLEPAVLAHAVTRDSSM